MDGCDRELRREPFTPTGPPIETSGWHDVVIKKVENGFIIRVGCKTFVATKWYDIYEDLAEYWTNPKAAEEKFCKS